MMQNSIVRNGLVLTLFALLVTGLISLTFIGTQDTIAAQQQQKLRDTLHAIIDANSYDNVPELDCVNVKDAALLGNNDSKTIYRATKQGQPVAAAIMTTAPDGYSGNIQIVVGITGDGTVTGTRVLEHKETPGLGDKIDLRVSDWILNFAGKVLSDDTLAMWKVKKDGGQFDQFTGATITPRAVVGAVRRAVEYYQQHKADIFADQNACAVQGQPFEETAHE